MKRHQDWTETKLLSRHDDWTTGRPHRDRSLVITGPTNHPIGPKKLVPQKLIGVGEVGKKLAKFMEFHGISQIWICPNTLW